MGTIPSSLGIRKACVVIAQVNSVKKVMEFLELVSPSYEGALPNTNPAKVLRDAMIGVRNIPAEEVCGKIITAFNHWAKGSTIKHLKASTMLPSPVQSKEVA